MNTVHYCPRDEDKTGQMQADFVVYYNNVTTLSYWMIPGSHQSAAESLARVNGWLPEDEDTAEAFCRMEGLRETTEQTMIAAHKAGMKYWQDNKSGDYAPTADDIASLARSCGWHGEDAASFVAGFFGAKRREAEADYDWTDGLPNSDPGRERFGS